MLERDEMHKLTDAGTQEMETQRFRLPLGEYREPHDAESHLGWCVWLPPRPPFKFPCAPSELDERRPTAGWSRERESGIRKKRGQKWEPPSPNEAP